MTERDNALLTIKQVASELQVCGNTVRTLLADNTIPSVLVGRLRRVRKKDLQAYIDSLDSTYLPVEWR